MFQCNETDTWLVTNLRQEKGALNLFLRFLQLRACWEEHTSYDFTSVSLLTLLLFGPYWKCQTAADVSGQSDVMFLVSRVITVDTGFSPDKRSCRKQSCLLSVSFSYSFQTDVLLMKPGGSIVCWWDLMLSRSTSSFEFLPACNIHYILKKWLPFPVLIEWEGSRVSAVTNQGLFVFKWT